jgi:hypothetical protein
MPGKSIAQQQAEQEAEAEGRHAENAYHPGFNRRATEYCMLGATNVELARFFGVHEHTVDRWLVEIPTFRKAVERGREGADARVAKALYHRATGYSHKAQKIFNEKGVPLVVDYIEHYPPDTNAAALWLTNRQRGRWRATGTHDGSAASFDLGAFVAGLVSKATDPAPSDRAKPIEPLDVVTGPAIKDRSGTDNG